jgi:hypothetical protein
MENKSAICLYGNSKIKITKFNLCGLKLVRRMLATDTNTVVKLAPVSTIHGYQRRLLLKVSSQKSNFI